MYEEIKHSVKIGEVLRRYGYPTFDRESYRIPCPIHRGRDANFSVSERDGLWNCFSVCGRGGSVIDLVAALDDITIPEAVKKLREDFQLTPIQAGAMVAREYKSKSERLVSFNKTESSEIETPELTWLEEGYRGFNARTISHWGLARTEEGVFIPLVDSRGRLCSYAIRRNNGNPKYDNAKGTSKCMPFGLFENKQDIINQGFAWVVEGQLDAIALWQKGHRNVIALMGSSMTEQQAMLILAVTSSLVLVMDGDEAGRNASAKIKRQWSNVFDIAIFNLPEGVDPDEFEGILER
jgi:DNA primase